MRSVLLKHALPLVRTHGFTRQALSLAVLSLPAPHSEPLSDMAISALFGPGDEARKTLIQAWLEEGINKMGRKGGLEGAEKVRGSMSMREALCDRLEWNKPVLDHLPEAFALLSIPRTSISLPLLDPRPAISHSLSIANEVCLLAGDVSVGTSWYTRRASIAAVYTATELHQLTSPETVFQFLDTLLESTDRARTAVVDAGELTNYVLRSWRGIIKSRGIV